MHSLSYRLLLGVSALALLAGCTTTTPGQATPGDATGAGTTTQPDETGSDELPTDGAPKVDDPLDTAKFQEDPCLSLTPEQSDRLVKQKSGRPYNAELGKACEWKNETTRGSVEVRFLDEYRRGLSAQYAVHNDGEWTFFEPLTVEGYPAVARGRVDRRPDGGCTVVVGASDEIAFEVVIQQSEDKVGTKDPCDVAADVAGEAVTTMKAG